MSWGPCYSYYPSSCKGMWLDFAIKDLEESQGMSSSNLMVIDMQGNMYKYEPHVTNATFDLD